MVRKKKNIVVTGGAGFLGSHLCDRFIADGNRVFCVDNLITGNLGNVRHLRKEKNFELIRHDVSKELRLKGRIDYVLHFASPASPVDYLNYPIQTMKVGALGTHNMLGVAKHKKATFLLASTSEVYGDPEVHPQKEEYWGNVTLAYHRVHKVDTKIVRIFNTYGPRMRVMDGRVIPNFIYQALHNKSLTVYGRGRQTRSFCYYTDLIDGVIKLLFSRVAGPINLGNPYEFTILQLAKRVVKLSGTKSKIVYKPLPEDDPKQRQPDITLARRKLKWVPKVDLEEGLKATLEWFREEA